ncbi:MAG: type II toxin-antitoxin system ParD family antitoxin [Tepidisphaeraceae bacterium]|jgi:putative addiction module CopG family antidote
MARAATINISLSPQELVLVRQRVKSGHYESASEVVRDGLRLLFERSQPAKCRSREQLQRRLASAYRATAVLDHKLARQWAQLPEAWPEE